MSAVSYADWFSPSATASEAARVDSRNDYVSTDQFLQLLITQMANQDPLNPMEDIDFTGQMAQLQALDEQIKTNKVMTAMRVDTQMTNVNGMIGKVVTGVDITGESVTGVVKRAVVESDVVFVELTNGKRLAADDVGQVYNQDGAVVEDLKNAMALIGWLVRGMTPQGEPHWAIVDAVTTDGDGNVILVGRDQSLLYYNTVSDISDYQLVPTDPGEDGGGDGDGDGEDGGGTDPVDPPGEGEDGGGEMGGAEEP